MLYFQNSTHNVAQPGTDHKSDATTFAIPDTPPNRENRPCVPPAFPIAPAKGIGWALRCNVVVDAKYTRPYWR